MFFIALKSTVSNWIASLNPDNRSRLIALDLLRGLFLVIIFADHLAYQPSLFFQLATNNSALLASAAEGFFVISGILVGYIYGPKIIKQPLAVAKKLWKRAGTLYLLTIVFTLLYTLWAYLLPDGYPRAVPYQGSAMEILFKTITLQYQFGWADFLGRYAVFMAVSPLVLWLIAKGYVWLVALLSVLVWYFYAFTPILQFYTAWQLIFMFGIIIGFYLPSIEAAVKRIPQKIRQVSWWSIVTLGVGTYIVSVAWIVIIAPHVLSILWMPHEIIPYFDKNSLAKGRIAVGVLWFLTLYLLFRRYEKWISSATKGSLLILGKASLFVYCLQAFIIFSVDVFVPAPENSPIILNTLVGVVGIWVVYIITKHRASIKQWVQQMWRALLHSK